MKWLKLRVVADAGSCGKDWKGEEEAVAIAIPHPHA